MPGIKHSDAVVLCDWLPPDFGAVGQYAMQFARRDVESGQSIVLVGLSRAAGSVVEEPVGQRMLTIVRIRSNPVPRHSLASRARWTILTNLRLVWHALPYLRKTREARFTGAPPFLVHLIVPLARMLRIPTCYRITDFFPECLMVTYAKVPAWLRLIYRLTNFWRRRVDRFEALGEDQKARLRAIGIEEDRIRIARDESPVSFEPGGRAATRPTALRDVQAILYSGNLGVAHDVATFVEGWRVYNERHAQKAGFWLNATGARVDELDAIASRLPFPYANTAPVGLETLAELLRAADVHLITLRDEFVGYVLPSKVYACIESGKPILFIGSERSDVHLLCARQCAPGVYGRVDVGDSAGVAAALERLLQAAK